MFLGSIRWDLDLIHSLALMIQVHLSILRYLSEIDERSAADGTENAKLDEEEVMVRLDGDAKKNVAFHRQTY